MDKKTIVILIGIMIVDSYQRLKDPYKNTCMLLHNSVWFLRRLSSA